MTCLRKVNITATTNSHHPRKMLRWITNPYPLLTRLKNHFRKHQTSCQPTHRHAQTNHHPTTIHNPLHPETTTNPGEATVATSIATIPGTVTASETENTIDPTMTDGTTDEIIATTDLTTTTTIADHRDRATATEWEDEDTPPAAGCTVMTR